VIPLLKNNGFILIDNALLGGKVADPELRASNPGAAAIHTCVNNLISDERLEVCSIMLADGITVARKK